MSNDAETIDRILSRREVLITCGTGGVGKTTLSAALGFRAAMLGKRAVVVTIDPAKRLATSLGLETLGDHPTDLTPALQRAIDAGRARGDALPEKISGSVHAIMPDTRKTFEAFVAELAPNPGVAERIMTNPIFQIFAKEFSGTNEYMAMERLLLLKQSGLYDCIIIDTPPSRNTLAFLNAPKLLSQLFEERLIRWLVMPANKIVSTGMRKALGVLERLTGAGFMTSLLDFASALFEVQVGFTANLRRITELLESEAVGFLMVSTPSPGVAPEAGHFIESVREHRFRFDGLALNRTLGYLELGNARGAAFDVIRELQDREDRVLAEFDRSGIALCAKLPELARDVHSVEDLLYVTMALEGDRGK